MRKTFIAAAILLLSASTLFAQDETPTRVTNQNRSGELPFSSSIGTAVEHVDAASGGLHVRIPLFSVPGRGMDSSLALRFDSTFWVTASRIDTYGNGYYIWKGDLASGWQLNSPLITS